MRKLLFALPLVTLLGGCSADDLVSAVQQACGFNIAITDAANLVAGQNATVQTVNALAAQVCKAALGLPPRMVNSPAPPPPAAIARARQAIAARPSGARTIVVNGVVVRGTF